MGGWGHRVVGISFRPVLVRPLSLFCPCALTRTHARTHTQKPKQTETHVKQNTRVPSMSAHAQTYPRTHKPERMPVHMHMHAHAAVPTHTRNGNGNSASHACTRAGASVHVRRVTRVVTRPRKRTGRSCRKHRRAGPNRDTAHTHARTHARTHTHKL